MLLPAVESFISTNKYYAPTMQRLKSVSKFSENSMSIDELKSELELRCVDYQDCLSKQELVQRLIESRATGKADPNLLKKFNTGNDVKVSEIEDELIDQTVSNDGNLPGGLSKELLKKLTSDVEIMEMIKDPKLQDIMYAVMAGGADGIKKYMSDPGYIN
jgi:hypothetical protein